jgi:hypothetical protein
MKVRQSTLGEADKCLRSMQYSIESRVYHGGVVRAIGTAYHKGLETYYNGERSIDGVVAVAKVCLHDTIELRPSHISEHSKDPGLFKFDEAFPDEETAAATVESMLRAYFDGGNAWPEDWAVLATEPEFHLPFSGEHTRDGSPDLVLQGPDGGIVVVDHKTAGKKWNYNKHDPRKQNQSPWLVAAMREVYPGAPSYRFAFDIMTYKGVFERRISAVTDAHIAAVEAKAVSVVKIYETLRAEGLDLPANPASTLCSPKYCDHWDICPHGSALDQ